MAEFEKDQITPEAVVQETNDTVKENEEYSPVSVLGGRSGGPGLFLFSQHRLGPVYGSPGALPVGMGAPVCRFGYSDWIADWMSWYTDTMCS